MSIDILGSIVALAVFAALVWFLKMRPEHKLARKLRAMDGGQGFPLALGLETADDPASSTQEVSRLIKDELSKWGVLTHILADSTAKGAIGRIRSSAPGSPKNDGWAFRLADGRMPRLTVLGSCFFDGKRDRPRYVLQMTFTHPEGKIFYSQPCVEDGYEASLPAYRRKVLNRIAKQAVRDIVVVIYYTVMRDSFPVSKAENEPAKAPGTAASA